MKETLITAVTCHEGFYHEELFLKRGYEVHGIKRRVSSLVEDDIARFEDSYGRA